MRLLNSGKEPHPEYFEIVGMHTQIVIGVCVLEGVEAALEEDPGCHVNAITKQQFDSYGNMPWASPIGRAVVLERILIVTYNPIDPHHAKRNPNR